MTVEAARRAKNAAYMREWWKRWRRDVWPNLSDEERARIRAQTRRTKRRYRELHPEQHRAEERRRWARNRERLRPIEANRNAVKRARRRGAEGAFTLQEWRDKCALLGNVCIYCGSPGPLERDHKTPVVRGGSNYITNIVPACRFCNASKGARTATEFLRWRVRHMEIVFDPARMTGACEICLRSECGEIGYVHLPGTPIQIGRVCVERMYGALPVAPVLTVVGAFTCADCPRTFARASALGSHRRVHAKAA